MLDALPRTAFSLLAGSAAMKSTVEIANSSKTNFGFQSA